MARVSREPAAHATYREGQEDQLAALGFALDELVLWNTQYMDDAVGHLRSSPRCSTSTS